MSLMLTRMLAYLTVVTYLVVGTMAVRFCLPESASVSFTTSYLNLVSDAPIQVAAVEPLNVPEIKFAAIKIPRERVIVKGQPKVIRPVVLAELIEKVSIHNELPFHEPVVLQKISINNELPTNLVASYKDFAFTVTVIAHVQEDAVSTKQAQAAIVEPEFFEYPETTPIKKIEAKTSDITIADVNAAKASAAVEVAIEPEVEDVSAMMASELQTEAAPSEVQEPEFFDYPEAVTTQTAPAAAATAPAAAPEVAKAQTVTSVSSDFVGFDYSRANQDVTNNVIPTVSLVSSHKPHKSKPRSASSPIKAGEASRDVPNNFVPDPQTTNTTNKVPKAPPSYPVNLSIVAMSSDLKKLEPLQGFEVRFQDDLSETLEDFGNGEVVFEDHLSQPKMTRTVTLIHRGHVPTTTELILEEGSGSVSIPMLLNETFNEIQQPYESKDSVGALLIELDDESKLAKIDVPFGDVIRLNGDFKKTDNDDFRYQLFVGVQPGNAMVSYHRRNDEVISKVVHIHENEMTYDANFYEDIVNEKVRLYEDNLLSKESSPLIVSGEQVKVFAGQGSAKKMSSHTYKMNFGASHLGGRRYLELNHQSEPVFVGFRENNNLTVPSESFMRFILSKVEGAKLGNRCLVQLNLTNKALKLDVASESVANSLMTYTQILDEDGKFYDSLSEKTQKVIIVGESQASGDASPDAKINIKIQYTDGTTQFLNSYCSPNTYIVEQL